MNERIRELAVEAGMIVGEANGFDMTRLMPKEVKFAQLIVQECAKIAVFKDSGTVATADVAGHMAAGRSIAARLIKEHFGVEE
jgi:hypothetical protein